MIGAAGINAECARSRAMVLVQMPEDSALIKSFRVARTMLAFAQGNLFQFNLNGTAILLPALVNCVKTINANGIAAATNFTVVANVTQKLVSPTTPTPPPATASSLQPDRPQEGSAELQLEAMQIASNFILKASSLSHPSLPSHLKLRFHSFRPVPLGKPTTQLASFALFLRSQTWLASMWRRPLLVVDNTSPEARQRQLEAQVQVAFAKAASRVSAFLAGKPEGCMISAMQEFIAVHEAAEQESIDPKGIAIRVPKLDRRGVGRGKHATGVCLHTRFTK